MRLRVIMGVCVCLVGVALAPWAWGEGTAVRVVPVPPVKGGNDFYVVNRPPLLPGPLVKLPVGAVRPEGWVRQQLAYQAEGFIGHLTEISKFLDKANNAWFNPEAGALSGRRSVGARGQPAGL